MENKLLKEAQELREKAEGYSIHLADSWMVEAPDPAVLAGYAENLAHVLGHILETLAGTVEMDGDSPSASRAYARLSAARDMCTGLALLIEHGTEDLGTFANSKAGRGG